MDDLIRCKEKHIAIIMKADLPEGDTYRIHGHMYLPGKQPEEMLTLKETSTTSNERGGLCHNFLVL